MDLAEQLIDDIKRFKTDERLRPPRRWCGAARPRSIASRPTSTRRSTTFEKGLREQRPGHRAVADLRLRGAQAGRPLRQRRAEPDASTRRRCSSSRASRTACRSRGKDFKTGQTLMKTILAPGFKARMLGLEGWYSTNILGNRDGEVLDDPGVVQDQGGVEARRARAHPPAATSTPTSTATSTTSCASTTTRRAATTKRAGTTSTSSGGSATRCRSRSTSSAATRSSPRRSSSTSRCSWTSRSARA